MKFGAYISKLSRPKIEILGKNKVGLQYIEDLNPNCILRHSGDTKIGHLNAGIGRSVFALKNRTIDKLSYF